MKRNNICKWLVPALVIVVIVNVIINIEMQKEIHCYQEELQNQNDGIAENGQLSVLDGQLVSENGDNITLRGLSSHGLNWYPKYTNASAMATLREYGANVFRIAMYTEQNGGYLYEEEQNKTYMYMAIENVLSQDMYVIVDWHVLREENPLKNVEEAKVFFEEISRHYANHEGIIYEICNEPNGNTTWADVCKYAQQIIPIIRANSPNAIIVVGTPDYCSDLDGPIQEPLPYDNVLYSFHKYINVSKEKKYSGSSLRKAIEAKVPIFVTEWGISYGDKDDSQIATYQDDSLYMNQAYEFIALLEENGISWCGWSLSNKAEAHSLILNKCDKLSGWTKEDMTPGGWFMMQEIMEYSKGNLK